jgi:hypothetical protein
MSTFLKEKSNGKSLELPFERFPQGDLKDLHVPSMLFPSFICFHTFGIGTNKMPDSALNWHWLLEAE